LILSCILRLDIPTGLFPTDFLTYISHVLFYEAPHYADFSSLPSHPSLLSPNIPLSTCSQTLPACVFPFGAREQCTVHDITSRWLSSLLMYEGTIYNPSNNAVVCVAYVITNSSTHSFVDAVHRAWNTR